MIAESPIAPDISWDMPVIFEDDIKIIKVWYPSGAIRLGRAKYVGINHLGGPTWEVILPTQLLPGLASRVEVLR